MAGEISLEQIRSSCDRDERILRNQVEDGLLAEDVERELASAECDPSTPRGALQRWAYLKYLFRRAADGLVAREDTEAAKTAAAHQLLAREPVEVVLESGRVVRVTGRSYQALYEIARHGLRLQELDHALRRATALEARCLAAMAGSPTRAVRARKRQTYRRVAEIHAELYTEVQLHRQAVFAHLFTPTGAAAVSLGDAPSWWEEIGPESERALMLAVWTAGPGRYAELGEAPAREKDARTPEETFGWHTHFAQIERSLKVAPATLRDRDLFQHLAWLRASAEAPTTPEEALDP